MVEQLLINNLAEVLLLIGLLLAITETVVPGSQLIVIGTGVFFAGLVALLFPPAANIFVAPVLMIVFSVVFFLVYDRLDIYDSNGTQKTKDSSSLEGQRGRIIEEVTATSGRVKLENGGFNPNYEARAFNESIPEGEKVIVVDSGGGNVVTVTALHNVEGGEIERELEKETN